MVNIQVYKYWEIKSNDGKIRKTRRLKCHSFVFNFILLMEWLMAHTYSTTGDTVTFTDTASASQAIVNGALDSNDFGGVESGTTDATYGMRVGTGTTAPTINDVGLQTPIAHGTGSGQLSHAATVVSAARVEGTSGKLLISRTFTNSSGGSITVRESGLIMAILNTAQKNVLIIHEAENQAIGNGTSGTLYYDIVGTV